MKVQEIEKIISENTFWQKERLISFCQENLVRCVFKEKLVILDYIDNIQCKNWNSFNSFCRGLVLDLDQKKIVAYPFDKFFSYNANEVEIIDTSEKIPITKKYDGTMITVFLYQNNTHCITRSSFDNFQIKNSLQIINSYYPKMKQLLEKNYTLIFEYISPKNRININYLLEELILLGIRDLNSGELLSYENLKFISEKYSLKLAEQVTISLEQLINLAKTDESEIFDEGWIISIGSKLIKLKSWKYLLTLRIIKEGLTKKQIIDKLFSNETNIIDIFIAELPDVFKNDIEKFCNKVNSDFINLKNDILDKYKQINYIESPKDFAFEVNTRFTQNIRSFLFTLKQGKPIDNFLKKDFWKFIDYYTNEPVIDSKKLKDWAFYYID